MKRRSRGEQMLAAAGLTAPAAVTKPAQQHSSDAKDDNDNVKSPPAKRARARVKDDSAGGSFQRPSAELDKPKQRADCVFKLPAELELLAGMFDALRTGRMMLKRRGEKVTYNSVRHVVENMTKREFRVEHLAQIKHLRPQAFDWQYIRTSSAANPLQMEVQLLLTFDGGAASITEGGCGGGSVGRYNGASELADFRAQLEGYAKANPVDPETGKLQQPIPQAQLPLRPTMSGVAPSRSGSVLLGGLSSPGKSAGGELASYAAAGMLQTASCPPGLLLGAQVAHPQAVPDSMGGLVVSPARDMSSGRSGTPLAMTHRRSRQLLPTGTESLPSFIQEGDPCAQRSVPSPHLVSGRRRANQLVDGEVALEDEDEEARFGAADGPVLELTQREGSMTTTQRNAFCSTAAASTPQSKGPRPMGLQTTPTSHQQQQQSAGFARLQSLLSPAAMQKILQAEAAQAAQTPEAKRRCEMRRAVQLLPHGHELVRLIFGLQGPTVKPLTQVAQVMCERSTQRQGLTVREASNTLVAMARAVPEFLRIEEARVMADGSARPRSVVISRAANINAVGAKLKSIAADPDAAVESIFERGGGGGAVTVAVRAESPNRGVTEFVPRSPALGLKPRALAQSLEDDAAAAALPGKGEAATTTSYSGRGGGGAAAPTCGSMLLSGAVEIPPPTPSSRRRPPGLPLAPGSPMALRCVQTPTRNGVVRADRAAGSILAAHSAQAAAAPSSAGIGIGGSASAASDGEGFLQKLCRTGAGAVAGGAKTFAASPAVAAAKDDNGGVGGTLACGAKEASQVECDELGMTECQEASGRTPSRVGGGGRTPGRTAVQEEMLNSIRRSSAKRSCRKSLDDELGVEMAGDDGEPVPRRLEESLVD